MRWLLANLLLGLALAGPGCAIKPIEGEAKPLLAEGRKAFEAKEYRKAAGYFKGIRKYHPDSVESEDAVFGLAECYRHMGDAEVAFDTYKKVLDDYPNSRFSVAVAEGEYALGLDYLEGRVPGFLFFGTPRSQGVDILEHMQVHFRHHPLADDALIHVAEYQLEKGYNRAVVDTLERLLSDYPRSPHTLRARYELGEARWRLNRGPLYDTRLLFDARRSFTDFIATTRQSGLDKKYEKQIEVAQGRIGQINNRLAERHYLTGRFYERTESPESAVIYYEAGIREFPQTEFGKRCLERLGEMRPDVKLVPEEPAPTGKPKEEQ